MEKDGFTKSPVATGRVYYLVEYTKCVSKKSVFFSKIKKSVFLPVFSRKPNSFRGPGGFCWRIGVTAALLGRLLPSDGHKLVKKPEI